MSKRLVAILKLSSLLSILLGAVVAYFVNTATPPLHPIVAASFNIAAGLLILVGVFIILVKIEDRR